MIDKTKYDKIVRGHSETDKRIKGLMIDIETMADSSDDETLKGKLYKSIFEVETLIDTKDRDSNDMILDLLEEVDILKRKRSLLWKLLDMLGR